MATGSRARVPAELKQLRDRIEHWRRSRVRRTAMPAAFWSEAVTLAQSAGAYPIARALRVNFEALKRRMAEAAAAADGKVTAEPTTAFVELAGAQILGASSRGGAIVELSDGTGIRVTVRLPADAEVDMARLLSAFRLRGDG